MDFNEDIQLCSNETLRMILEHQRKQNDDFKKMAYVCLFSSVLIIFSVLASFFWFTNNYEIVTEEVTTTTTTTTQEVDGEGQIHNIEGDQYNDNSSNNK